MPAAPSLQPTPWRTCRVLANPTRLAILRWLCQQPGRSVTDVADCLKLTVSLSSQYLRALEARGLLSVERRGRRVVYRPVSARQPTVVSGLVVGLKSAFKQERDITDTVYRLATAFTHPRRVEIYRLLHTRPQATEELLAHTNVSLWALRRHLRKLESRGFIARLGVAYGVVPRSDSLGTQIARFVIQ